MERTSTTLMTLREAAKQVCIPGITLTQEQLWKWCKYGIRGVRLRHARIGRVYATREVDILEFTAALAEAYAAPKPKQQPQQTPIKRTSAMDDQKNLAGAKERLSKLGL